MTSQRKHSTKHSKNDKPSSSKKPKGGSKTDSANSVDSSEEEEDSESLSQSLVIFSGIKREPPRYEIYDKPTLKGDPTWYAKYVGKGMPRKHAEDGLRVYVDINVAKRQCEIKKGRVSVGGNSDTQLEGDSEVLKEEWFGGQGTVIVAVSAYDTGIMTIISPNKTFAQMKSRLYHKVHEALKIRGFRPCQENPQEDEPNFVSIYILSGVYDDADEIGRHTLVNQDQVMAVAAWISSWGWGKSYIRHGFFIQPSSKYVCGVRFLSNCLTKIPKVGVVDYRGHTIFKTSGELLLPLVVPYEIAIAPKKR